VAPSAVVAALGTATRTINVSWADNSLDETGFLIQRATAATGPYTDLTTVSGVTSFVDSGGALLTGNAATYFYRVTAVRGPDRSTVAQSAGLPTPTAAGSVLGLAATSDSTTRITLNWTNRAGATSNQIFRSVGAGPFTLLTTVGAAVATYSDDTVTAPNSYRYHVDATNWAGPTPSGNTAALVPQVLVTLNAVTNLAATPAGANPPALSWTDNTTGESGNRVQRRTVTLSNAGARTNGAFATVSTTAGNATGFTDAVQTANAIVEYSVAPLNGATVGPVVSVAAVPGGIPGVIAAPTFTRVGNTVTVRWLQAGTNAGNRAGIGGYSVQRCTVTATDTCVPASAGWAPVATATGRTTVTANNTVTVSAPARTYVYRVVSTTGSVVTGVTGTASPASLPLVR
jgi:hypothetical protein